jgi:predicted RND superfamily exporter protein
MMQKTGKLIIKYRWLSLLLLIGITCFFIYGITKIGFYTAFSDLLPPDHPYIMAYNKYKKVFGGANVVVVSLEVKEGNIYNLETLAKIKKITDFFEMTSGVNDYQILSLSRAKVKDTRTTAWGLESRSYMHPYLPKNEEEIKKLKDKIYSNLSVYGQIVSRDDKAALITAELYEGRIDYNALFKRLSPFLDSFNDENTTINYAGVPILQGWLYHHMDDVMKIFLLTLGVMVVVLLFFMRNWVGLVVPLLSAFVSAVWGLGFAGFMGFHFDPLMLVVPFLISARTLSHSIQVCSRWIEEMNGTGDSRAASEATFAGLFRPGSVSILTDAGGVFIIAIAPIPILRTIAFMGSFWILTNILTVFVLNPIVLSFISRYKTRVKKEKKIEAVLYRIGELCAGKKSRWVLLAPFVVLAVFAAVFAPQLKIGDANPGSPLLWPDSYYNRSEANINKKFPGSDQLMVYVVSEDRGAVKIPEVLFKMDDIAEYVGEHERVGGALSIVQFVKTLNKVFHYDHPYWGLIPKNRIEVANIYEMGMGAGEPGDFDRWIDYDMKISNVLFFLKDHTGSTIESVVARAKEFIANNPFQTEGVEFQLAGGYVGTLAGANDVIAKSHEMNLVAVLSFTFICCTIAYRSFAAGFIFILSLVLANFFTLGYMAFKGMGMNINTIPVVSIGIGLGVDYGLYVVSRIVEAYKDSDDLKKAISVGISTSGLAVLITAITMIAGVGLWYFSPIRFQAEMSLLLTIVLTVNLFGGMILLPLLIYLIKPRFVVGRAV